jgi:hypothetical protein
MCDTTAFSSDKEFLADILKGISVGKTQLPEFQRGWVWDDAHIQSLLASISLSYPIGAAMMLETGNPEVKFKPRPIEGVELDDVTEPERYILDGQQRLTSLFQSIFTRTPVETRDVRGKTIERLYYIDMVEAIKGTDRDECIVSLPGDKVVKNFRGEATNDLRNATAEFEQLLFPLNQVFDPYAWREGYNNFWGYSAEKTKLFDDFERKIIGAFKQYQIPVILLKKQTPKEAVCQVFEKVNTGGVSLTVFELITATFAAEDFHLREDWDGPRGPKGRKTGPGRVDRLHELGVLKTVSAPDFLTAISLVTSYDRKQRGEGSAVSCKRADVLKLKLDDYKTWADRMTKGFIKAARFLMGEKVFDVRQLPYSTQLIPLSAALIVLGDKAESDAVRQKLSQWFWCGVFGELYGSTVETRFAKDLPELIEWINGGPEPTTVAESNFVPARLLTLKTRRSAAYKGISAIILRDGGLDFKSGEQIEVQQYFDDKIDVHHIFPKDYCKKNGIERKRRESIVNKTPISAKTNRSIGGRAPSAYLATLFKSQGIESERMSGILRSHLIDPVALQNDDFDAFFAARSEEILTRIEAATGKKITREVVEPESDWSDDEIEDDED